MIKTDMRIHSKANMGKQEEENQNYTKKGQETQAHLQYMYLQSCTNAGCSEQRTLTGNVLVFAEMRGREVSLPYMTQTHAL